jgi:hypothetical protein
VLIIEQHGVTLGSDKKFSCFGGGNNPVENGCMAGMGSEATLG